MIRVVVLDRSIIDRSVARRMLGSDPEVSVVGEAAPGQDGVDLVARSRPEVVLLGVDPGGVDSYGAIRHIMADCPTPILLFADPEGGQVNGLARMLSAGALDAMERPRSSSTFNSELFQKELLLRVKLLARVPVITHVAGKQGHGGHRGSRHLGPSPNRSAIAVVASTGGPMALTALLSGLPPDISSPVLVVQHMARGFMEGVTRWLQERSGLTVRLAENGDVATAGTALVSPDGSHMMVGSGGRIELDGSAAEGGVRPRGDRLFQSLAAVYGAGSIGVVLTGMGDDGVRGARAIRMVGGRVIAQDESTSTIFGMPRATIDAGLADEILPLGAIAGKLVEWTGRRNDD